ncbi:MAG: hypothetical protein SFU87_10050 [Chitinophagaceae bacterium]|nr:hypothetical protein [Chitinophagaceae bacterium]
MFTHKIIDSSQNYWHSPNFLLQKFPADGFKATVKLSFKPVMYGESCGLIIFGSDYAFLSMLRKADGNYLSSTQYNNADKGNKPTVQDGEKINSTDIYFRVTVCRGAACKFSYSEDGKIFNPFGGRLRPNPDDLPGAKLDLFCSSTGKANDAGFADIDWFRIELKDQEKNKHFIKSGRWLFE